MAQNYTLGRGRVYFARFDDGETPGTFRHLGNSPEMNLTIETENLDHVSSESGVREVDDSVALSVTRSGTLILDDIQPDNLGMFFFSEAGASTLAQDAVGTDTDYTLPGTDRAIKSGETFFIGVSASSPVGIRDLTKLVVKTPGSLTVNTHFTTDPDAGSITFTDAGETALMSNSADVVVTYQAATAKNYPQILSGSAPIQGAMRLIEDNPKGNNNTWIMPKVTIRPNGDISLKGDEWRQIPLALTVEKPAAAGTSALYIIGDPA